MSDPGTLHVRVDIHQGKNGEVWSSHDYASPEDASMALQWPSGGHRQVAHGLLLEAVRREAFTTLLIRMSTDPEMLPNFLMSSPEEREKFVAELSRQVTEILSRNCARMVVPSVQEVLKMVMDQTAPR